MATLVVSYIVVPRTIPSKVLPQRFRNTFYSQRKTRLKEDTTKTNPTFFYDALQSEIFFIA